MAGHAPSFDVTHLEGKRIAIISARWHREICQAMVAGAQRALTSAGITNPDLIEVAGSFELPLAAKIAFDSGIDSAVVLGVVVRGETPHFDYVCQGVTEGIMNLSLSTGKPIGFGVLTVDTVEQAIARSGVPGSKEDKGYDSAMAALDLLRIKEDFSR
ncbi:MAG: 6,7-dimethyl-8-ribityllumazine synthase [Actinomycetales bacterium]|nr:6,7-dimethyl-8-ribityllumazine synthase [Actinomycetales bacterium]